MASLSIVACVRVTDTTLVRVTGASWTVFNAAIRGPKAFRRQAKSDTAAAAIVWIVGRANHIFDGRDRLMLASRVVHCLGVRSSASSRAGTFIRAAEFGRYTFDFRLDADYLVSGRRRRLIEKRDRYSYTGSL